ncbi:MAG: zinc metallopeptidase [Bacillota bacterium]
MFYWYDSGYFLFVLPALFFALWAQGRVRSAYQTYSRVHTKNGRPAYEVAASLLRDAGLGDVRIQTVRGELRDHYDPRNRTLSLSAGTYNSTSVAALAIAAHEVGHAVQHHVGYAPLALRNSFVPVANIGSNLAIPLFFMGVLFSNSLFMDLGLLFFLTAVVFQVITLPVEYNASKRALDMLEVSGFVASNEVIPVGNMLNAAALTYVAATAVALAQFLRLLAIRGRRD